MIEGKVESHRDAKAAIYLQGVGGIVFTSMGLSGLIHHTVYHNPNMVEVLTFILVFILGCYLIYRAYQEFKEKYHQFALAISKKL
jgi:ABC-type nickel/cobalt efflux system permease component RcnA